MAKRPLFFAYEDRSQITNLTVETYELTPAAATEFLKKQIDASDLWEKTDALMSDTVAKTLQTERTVPKALNYQHEPCHIHIYI